MYLGIFQQYFALSSDHIGAVLRIFLSSRKSRNTYPDILFCRRLSDFSEYFSVIRQSVSAPCGKFRISFDFCNRRQGMTNFGAGIRSQKTFGEEHEIRTVLRSFFDKSNRRGRIFFYIVFRRLMLYDGEFQQFHIPLRLHCRHGMSGNVSFSRGLCILIRPPRTVARGKATFQIRRHIPRDGDMPF